MNVAALDAAIRNWTIVRIRGNAIDLDQPTGAGKTLRGSIEPPGRRRGSAQAIRPTASPQLS